MLNKNELTTRIIEKVRAACVERDIVNGAIGVCYEPSIATFQEWAGTPAGSLGELHFAEITKSQDTLCFDDDNKIAGDSLGIVAMKIAGVRRLMLAYEDEEILPTREQCTSGSLPDEMVITGTSNWKGAVAIEIGALGGYGCPFRGAKALTVYVGVSGGTEEQDEAAAWTALDVIKESIEQDFPNLMLARMFYD